MWYIVTFGVATSAISLIEVPKLKKKNQIKELWVFSILLVIGFSLLSAYHLHVQLPNPLDLITFIFQPLSDLLYKMLN